MANCFNPLAYVMACQFVADPRIILTVQHTDNYTDKATAMASMVTWYAAPLNYFTKLPSRSKYTTFIFYINTQFDVNMFESNSFILSV